MNGLTSEESAWVLSDSFPWRFQSIALLIVAMRLLVLFASIIIALLPGAQGNEIDDYVLKAMREQGVPAISMAVVKNGKITMAKGYGLANVESNVPATEK